jgi:hypothetical protein
VTVILLPDGISISGAIKSTTDCETVLYPSSFADEFRLEKESRQGCSVKTTFSVNTVSPVSLFTLETLTLTEHKPLYNLSIACLTIFITTPTF